MPQQWEAMERKSKAMLQNAMKPTSYHKANSLRITWLIAWRQIGEAFRNRSTIVMTGFFLLLQTVLIWFSLRPLAQGHVSPREADFVGTLMAFYLLYVGLMPTTPAVGIAAGVFAGDKERGCLTPLLVTPASNSAIFAGKVLGAVLPALLCAVIGIVVYFVEISLFFGSDKLTLLPVSLVILILLAIPAIALLGAALASIISSRVNTFQSSQNYSSLIVVVLWFGLAGLLFLVSAWGLWTFAAAVIGLYVIDVLLVGISAATWRREEVMARQ
jgi:ABC-type Na+ efflux pump permease subunit